jgi:endonuclease/exonuclease/phosphatase family metal-dependent hydrolase
MRLTLLPPRTIYGLPACSCQRKWLPVYVAELKRRGIVIRFVQLIGGGKKSGGTHSTGGADDAYLVSWPKGMTRDEAWRIVIWVGRQMGADARWRRRYNWDNRGGEEHGHGVLTGCPHNGPARYQIEDVREGLNGLVSNARDDGPRPLSGRTWKQGIVWAQKQAKPVQMTHTDLVIYQQNMGGDKGNITPRAQVIAKAVRASGARMVVGQEMQAKYRTPVSRALKALAKMSMVSNHKNLVQYLVDNRTGWKARTKKKWSIGNGRYALAVRYQHRTTGAEFVLITFHSSWEHKAWRKRKTEAANIGALCRKTWPKLPWIAVGDANDSHKDTSTRPNDTTCDVLESYGFHDLYYDVPEKNRKREQYNTANQFKTPPPTSGIHIDRFFGTESVDGLEWEADVTDDTIATYPSDHWGVHMKIRITHPVK